MVQLYELDEIELQGVRRMSETDWVPTRERVLLERIAELEAENEHFRKALASISLNTCCTRCQEAALVARQALKESDK